MPVGSQDESFKLLVPNLERALFPVSPGYFLFSFTSIFSSFDMRGRDSEDGKHWSATEPFGNRAFFRTGTDPTFLLINDVKLEVSCQAS